jgi:uncharacterized caspase-like protein
MLIFASLKFSSPMQKDHKKHNFVGLVFGLSLLLRGSGAWALDCNAVAEIDQQEGAGGAFLMWSGCSPLNAKAIADRWTDLPEIAQIVFAASYAVPGQTFPDLGPGSRADELTTGDWSLLKTWAISNFLNSLLHSEFWFDKVSDYYQWDWLSSEAASTRPPGLDTARQEILALLEAAPVFEQVFTAFDKGFNFSETFPFMAEPEDVERIARDSDIPIATWLVEAIERRKMLSSREPLVLSSMPKVVSSFPPQQASAAGHLYAFESAGIEVKGDLDIEAVAAAAAESGYLVGITFAGVTLLEAGRLSNKRFGYEVVQAAASYGSPLSIWLKALTHSSFGEFYDLSSAEAAYLELSKAGFSLANPQLFFLALNRGDYHAAAEWAMKNSMEGATTYQEAGYEALAKVIPMLGWPKLKQQAFLTDLHEHCLAEAINITQDDPVGRAHDACKGFGGESDKNDLHSILEIDEQALEARITLALETSSEPVLSLDPGKYMAIMISNSEYEEWEDLESPLKDAQLIGATLSNKYGFEVHYVVNETRRNILGSIYEAAKSLTFNDHLLIYYAGHGVVDDATQNAYWIPSQAPRDFRPDWISGDELLDALKVVPSRHVLLVADSCYSGRLLRSGLPAEENPNQQVIERLFSKRARVALTSGGDEPVVDSAGSQKNSVFALALSDALKSADSALPVSSIYKQIFKRVASELSQTPQYDGIRELGHDGGDFVFIPVDSN